MLETIVKKSRFLSCSFDVSSQSQVKEILSSLTKEHKKATHICYAYILSNPHLEKAFDDGEPNHTAGLPILNVLQKRNLCDKLIVVIRYFGGIKLGVGGLVRAYSNAASKCLEEE